MQNSKKPITIGRYLSKGNLLVFNTLYNDLTKELHFFNPERNKFMS